MKPILTVNDVKLTIDGRPILKGVNLVVNEGEIHAILGPNGAGKSSTIRVMATLQKPGVGDVRIDGVSVRRYPDKIRHKIRR